MLLGIAATACFAAATILLVSLHAAPTGLRPVRDAVSDYGATPWHRRYRAMAVLLGIGAILLAVGLARETNARDVYWLWAYGVSRIAIAGFMTDRNPPPVTTQGRIHWLLAAVAFTAIAFAAVTIRWAGDPDILHGLGYAVAAAAVATLLTRAIPPFRPVFGLVERLLYVTSIAWLVIAAVSLASG
jgi:Protein of unknown function (DUF998)